MGYPGELTNDGLEELIEDYTDLDAPSNLPGFFAARANGEELRQHGLLCLS